MGTLLAIPTLILTLMLQMVVANRLPLLQGTVDLMLLVMISWALQERVRYAWLWGVIGGVLVTFVSAMPAYISLIAYVFAVAIARLLQQRVWQSPILALLVSVVAGTMVTNLAALVGFQVFERPISLQVGLSLVTIPSLLLNLLLAFPVYTVMSDLASWLYPPVEA